MTGTVTETLYLIAAGLFILALRWMSRPETARRAVGAAVTGMLLAVGGTLISPEIVTYKWIALAAGPQEKQKRLDTMLDELEKGGVYRGEPWTPPAKKP